MAFLDIHLPEEKRRIFEVTLNNVVEPKNVFGRARMACLAMQRLPQNGKFTGWIQKKVIGG